MLSSESVWNVLSNCGVCDKSIVEGLSLAQTPQLLPCCHSACKDCIDDQLAALQDRRPSNTNTYNDGSAFKCKICSQEYSPNDCIENSFQILHWAKNPANSSENKDKICQSCEGENKPAVIRCEDCDWICGDCFQIHKKFTIFKAHKLDDNTKIEKSLPNNMCSEHNELITVYCKTCKIAYCARCILKDHNLHVYEDTKDSEQLKKFYDNFTKQVEQIKEKRSFTENTLEKFVTIETNVSDQKSKCIEKIISITDKLQEKIAELGKSMLDKVNGICQQKETEFTAKKTELNQLNSSFKYIEEFMSAIMELNDPMSVMKAQDLLNNQLEKLLNKPCSHPDFVKAFEITVVDQLEDQSKNFSVEKMIDGVFNMCFKLKTSDDPIEKTIEVNVPQNEAIDEDIVEITPNANCVQIQNNSRGNREKYNNNNRKTKQSNTYAPNYNNFQNANNNNLRTQGIADTQVTQRLQNNSCHSMHLQSLNTLTNSVPHTMQQMPNNFTQTGIATLPHIPVATTVPQISYGSPQVYRGTVSNQLRQNSIIIPTSISNQQNYNLNLIPYANPPNITIPFNSNTVRIQQMPQNVQQMQQTVQRMPQTHQPIQQTPFNQNIRTLAGGTITYPQQTPQPYSPAMIRSRQQLQQTPNTQLLYHLHQPSITSVPTDPRIASMRNMPGINQMRPPLQTPNNRTANTSPNNGQQIATTITNSTTNVNNNNNVNNTQIQRTTNNSSPRDQTSPNTSYQLHIPEQPIVKNVTQPTPPSGEEQNPLSTNINESVINRRNSGLSVTPPITQNEPNEQIINTGNEGLVAGIESRSQSTDSGIQTSPQSIHKDVPQTEPQTHSSTNSEPIHTANSSSVDSTITQSSVTTSNSNESSTTNTSNKDENKENKELSASSRSTAPVARIPPLTPEIDLSDATDGTLEEEIDEDADCVVCRKEYGEFICCERCPRAFHIDCHVPELKRMPDSTFVCTFCKTIPTLQSNGRVVKHKLGLNDRQQAMCERILIALLCHKKSYHFRPPHSASISSDLDLNIVKKKLETNKYEEERDFVRDIQQIFTIYNSSSSNPDSEDKEDYKTVEIFFHKLVLEFMPHFAEFSNQSRDLTTPSTTKRNRLN